MFCEDKFFKVEDKAKSRVDKFDYKIDENFTWIIEEKIENKIKFYRLSTT